MGPVPRHNLVREPGTWGPGSCLCVHTRAVLCRDSCLDTTDQCSCTTWLAGTLWDRLSSLSLTGWKAGPTRFFGKGSWGADSLLIGWVEFAEGVGEVFNEVQGGQREAAQLFGGHVAGQAVDVDAQDGRVEGGHLLAQ